MNTKITVKLPIKGDPCDILNIFNNHICYDNLKEVQCLSNVSWLQAQTYVDVNLLKKILNEVEYNEDLDALLGLMDMITNMDLNPSEILNLLLARYDTNFVFISEYYIRIKEHNWTIGEFLLIIQMYSSLGLIESGLRMIKLLTEKFDRATLCAYKFNVSDYCLYNAMLESCPDYFSNLPNIELEDEDTLNIATVSGQKLTDFRGIVEDFLDMYEELEYIKLSEFKSY